MANLKITEFITNPLSGREVLVKCRNGNATLTVEVSQADIAKMIGRIEPERLSASFLDDLRKFLAAQLRRGKGSRKFWPTTIDHLKSGYSAFFGTPWADMIAPIKRGVLVEQRSHVYLHLSGLGYSDPEIAYHFAKRHRSTIIVGIQTARDREKLELGFRHKQKVLGTFMAEWMVDGDVESIKEETK